MEGVQQAIKTAGERMGYFTLKDEQLRIAADVLGGWDGFVCLPTGYGKSLCYTILPWAFDELSRMRKDDKHSIVLVVSPLVSLTGIINCDLYGVNVHMRTTTCTMTYTLTGVAALLVHASKRGRFGLDAPALANAGTRRCVSREVSESKSAIEHKIDAASSLS